MRKVNAHTSYEHQLTLPNGFLDAASEETLKVLIGALLTHKKSWMQLQRSVNSALQSDSVTQKTAEHLLSELWETANRTLSTSAQVKILIYTLSPSLKTLWQDEWEFMDMGEVISECLLFVSLLLG